MSDKPENFLTCFIKHLQAFHNNSYNSDISKHLLENQHPIDTIKKIMEILYATGKVSHFNTVKKYYSHVETLNNNYLNDQNTIEQNALFSTLFQLYH
jgi:hypothetical protein